MIPGTSSRPAAAVAALLEARGETLAVAESSAGGLINAALVAVPGASKWYLGGAIIYTPKGRGVLLGLSKDDLADVRSATEGFALILASRTREKLGATWGLGETGASGPTGNRYGDAPGHACIAVAGPKGAVITVETGSAEREANMWAFAERALRLLEECIRGQTPNP
ncbi:MAG TPA: CinA family protein [Burkholderiales bacterium]|nr:CinA family protein [Burkholderiales bacterium]